MLWEGMDQCLQSRFFQQWCKVPWRRQGLLEGRSESSQEQHKSLQMCRGLLGAVGAAQFGEHLRRKRVAGTDAQEPAFVTRQPREVPVQQSLPGLLPLPHSLY